MISRSDLQLTIDGREEPIPGPLAPVQGSVKVQAPALFDAGAFAPRVPGTLALDLERMPS